MAKVSIYGGNTLSTPDKDKVYMGTVTTSHELIEVKKHRNICEEAYSSTGTNWDNRPIIEGDLFAIHYCGKVFVYRFTFDEWISVDPKTQYDNGNYVALPEFE